MKKFAKDKLQELRNKDHSAIRYKKRKQQEEDDEQYLKDEIKHLKELHRVEELDAPINKLQ